MKIKGKELIPFLTKLLKENPDFLEQEVLYGITKEMDKGKSALRIAFIKN